MTPLTAEPARERFLAYWRQDGAEHFREEEEILLPAYARHANPHRPLITRVLCDHVLIRGLAATVADPSPPLAVLQELGVALADHVRLEERELFPLIEDAVPATELEHLAEQLSNTHP